MAARSCPQTTSRTPSQPKTAFHYQLSACPFVRVEEREMGKLSSLERALHTQHLSFFGGESSDFG